MAERRSGRAVRKNPTVTRTLASRFLRFCLEEAELQKVWPRDVRLAMVERHVEGRADTLPSRLIFTYRKVMYGHSMSYDVEVMTARIQYWLDLPENKLLLAEKELLG